MKRSVSHVLSGLLVLLLGATPVSADPYTVVADGLDNPRGLAFGEDGRLYVTQVGSGGMTGKVSEIRHPWLGHSPVRDIVTGLPSISDGQGGFAGANGLSRGEDGALYLIMGTFYTDPPAPPGRQGHLLLISPQGRLRDLADVATFDYNWWAGHPELSFLTDHPDANPYGVLATDEFVYVVDSATNTLDRLRNGRIEVIAFFPDNTFADATPTCVAEGPDHALYVGTLAMVDSLFAPATPTPSATIYRVDPRAANPGSVMTVARPWARGLWPINGCAFGPSGDLYVSELANGPDLLSGGDVVKIPFRQPDVHISLTGNALSMPASVAVARDGTVYVANGTAFVPSGQVLRLSRH